MSNFRYLLQKNREEMLPYFLWLALTNDIGIRRYKRLQSLFESPKELYFSDFGTWEKSGVFTKKQLEKLEAAKKENDIFKISEGMVKKGIDMLIFDDENYPKKLMEIPSPPVFLFMKGELKAPLGPMVSVIGARQCSLYGSKVAAKIGELLALNNITLVSGMARGIDSISQEACVDAGGYSVGVLGGGPDICYPKESAALYSKLETRGCIISEYAPGVNPQPQFFACRNRIISGLADVICVIEAREKSGTMITVDAALEQGRDVYALPGRITDATSAGCNELIRQGAGVINAPEVFVEEILNHYSTRTCVQKPKSDERIFAVSVNCELEDFERKIIIFSSDDSFTFEEISIRTGITSAESLVACMGLVKKQLLQSMGAGRFCMTDRGMAVRKSL